MRYDKYHAVVVGGGLVGASLALALARAGKRVALLEAGEPAVDGLEQGWDARVYAVSPANRRFLDGMGAWPDMARIGTIASMDVRGDAGGRISFSAATPTPTRWPGSSRTAGCWPRCGRSCATAARS
ncbi:2-octaprenyl-3-methyl-6-methoxy-1,4-benzoquinol hydroxylase [Chromobacterium violaceum]|uniref:2-octaprenyl-3-methyl-6-methoxy-1,4-benzoquinol hydroxylase n=1 Tax=Chromobacterium violaceum TaxID=536 RepID=A0A447TGZ4_CHRVL|nr:2-octaprenyl-3-methyl-6-methoxy-1,4-benzoquinol hydroxylase [Chromobacterium violaceum]